MTPLHLHSRNLIGGTLIEVTGELDATNTDQLSAYIEHEHPQPELPLVLDLAELTFIDSSGLHLLIEQHHREDEHGAGLHLASPHRRIARILWLTGVGQMLHTYATLGQAVKAADLIDPRGGDPLPLT
ncbi:STAS domain-containing protein [Nonomuraea sp. NPDC050394]|uniref:STAS domain-containing protein n=1 Tax=Nonomuraea sp. NPDC050394 TaxID=3364363 RepID=UPI0037A6B14B